MRVTSHDKRVDAGFDTSPVVRSVAQREHLGTLFVCSHLTKIRGMVKIADTSFLDRPTLLLQGEVTVRAYYLKKLLSTVPAAVKFTGTLVGT